MDASVIAKDLNIICRALAQKPEVNTVYLYGSFAKGDAVESSDIDIGIYMDPACKLDLHYMGELQSKLEALAKDHKIDSFVINNMSPLFRFNVIYPNKVLYCKDQEKRVDFELKTRRDYEDYLPFFNYRTEMAVKESKRRINERATTG